MGARGPRPKPLNLILLNGNAGHHTLPENPVNPTPVLPKPPAHLDQIAKKEWKRVAPELFKLGVLSLVDLAALEGYCENYAIWVRMKKEIIAQGGYAAYITGKNSQTIPELAAMKSAFAMLKTFAAEFGMTPSSRGRMNVERPKDSIDPLDEYLRGGAVGS